METRTIEYNGYTLTTDRQMLQPQAIHSWLSNESYWSKNIPRETVLKAFDHSFVVGVLKDGTQVGYARLVTDYATFAYLADVYVQDKHRGLGLAKKMMELIMELDWVRNLRRIMLATLDAHELYRQFGFVMPAFPERFMEISRPAIYGDPANTCQ